MATLWSGQISDVLIYSSSPTYSPTATKGHPMIRPDLRCIDLQYSPTYSPTVTKGHPMIRPDLRCIDLQ